MQDRCLCVWRQDGKNDIYWKYDDKSQVKNLGFLTDSELSSKPQLNQHLTIQY